MKFAHCVILIALAGMGATLLMPDAPAVAAKRKAEVLKTKRRGDFAVAQILPALPRISRRSLSGFKPLRKTAKTRCIHRNHKMAPPKTIADALLVAPNSTTIELLADYGLPIIEGIPPIFILFPDERKSRETAGF